MAKVKGIKQQIAGKSKQAVGEIVGDQELHERGKAEAKAGKKQREEPSKLNLLRCLNRLT